MIIAKPDIRPEECRENLKHIHTTITSKYLSCRKNKRVTNTTPYDTHLLEQILPRHIRAEMPQFRANKSPPSPSYLHTVNPKLTRHNTHYACLTHT